MTEETPRRGVTFEEGRACGFNDEWHEAWWSVMEENGGNIIAAYRMRTVSADGDSVVMSMPYQAAARQGTGVFAAGILMQLADVAATSVCFDYLRRQEPDATEVPFPLSVQISMNLMRNTDHGTIYTETKLVHGGRRMMVAESRITDEDSRLLATMTSTHMVARQ